MEETKPTEWTAENVDDGGPWFYHDADGNRVIVSGYWVRGPQALGNMESAAFTREDATLMAAAPALRDAAAKAQAVLAMMTRPDAISGSSVLVAYQQAMVAESLCRAALALAAVSPPAAEESKGANDA